MSKIKTVRCALNNPTAIASAIRAGDAFTASNMHGEPRDPAAEPRPYTGWMQQDTMTEDVLTTLAQSDYVVYSYQTPIAWRARGMWTMPDVKYSASTGRQQAALRRALGIVQISA